MSTDANVREHVSKLLSWEDAHVGFETVINGIPDDKRGAVPAGLPYSLWQVIEHIRIAQHDILDFCRNASYQEMKWPADYWPQSPAPPSQAAWDDSVEAFRRDRRALQDMANDASLDLTARIPHGQGQTYLRELVLVADHTAYHVGELVVMRRLLGIWKPPA
jgi:uncharacterized damage-inducible protein DinB